MKLCISVLFLVSGVNVVLGRGIRTIIGSYVAPTATSTPVQTATVAASVGYGVHTDEKADGDLQALYSVACDTGFEFVEEALCDTEGKGLL